MNEPSIPARLKRVRETAKLSIRKVADALGMPASTYQHYENDYKKAYLPPELAQHLAALFAQYGVDPTEVLSLGGMDRKAMERLRLRENDVVEYRTEAATVNGPAVLSSRIEAVAAALTPDRPQVSLWLVKGAALELAGYRPGDMLVTDIKAKAQAGDVVVAQHWQAGTARTVLRLFQPPYLLAANTNPIGQRPELVDGEHVIVKAVVIASFRIAGA